MIRLCLRKKIFEKFFRSKKKKSKKIFKIFELFFSKISKIFKSFTQFYIFSWNHQFLIKNTPVKTKKTVKFVKKIINFDFFLKKFSPAAGTLSGSSCGEQSPTADCVGAKGRDFSLIFQKNHHRFGRI